MAGFFHHLENVLKGSSTRVLLDSGNAQFRGVEIIAAVDRAASTLDACGVRTGDRVVVQVEKSCHAIFLFLGTLKLGAVFVPLNTSYRLQEFTYFVENSRPTLIVCDPEREAAYSALAAKNGVRLVTLGADGDGSLYESDASNFNPKPFPQISDEHLAAIIYTSGTTGRPKGAMLSHGNVLHNTRALGKVWNITSNDVLLHVLPLYHVHGLFIALSTTLLMGARTRLLPRFEVEATIEELSRATIFMGVPTYYTRLLADVDFTRHAAENVRLFVCGSAPLRVETFDAFLQRSGKRLVERYGMSECGIICANAPDDARRGYVGRPIPDTSVRVTDDQGEVLPSNCIGTLEVRGPSIFGGYWKMPELTASEFRPDGYFVTAILPGSMTRAWLNWSV